jgi:predicted PurR-regulated permease PerM
MTRSAEKAERDRYVRRTLLGAIVLIGVAAALWLMYRLRTVIFMVFVSLFVTVALEPPVHYLAKRGMRRGAATGLVLVAGLFLFVAFLLALAPLFVEQVTQLVESIPDVIESLTVFLNDTFGLDLSEVSAEEIGQQVLDAVQGLGGTVVGGFIGLTASVVGFLVFATTVALFSFYMIAELPKLQRTVLSAMPEEGQRRAMHIWNVAVEKMGGYIYSRVVLAILSALITWGFLSILDVRFAVSLGIWVGILSQFIPVIGTYLASILPALVALTFNDLTTAIWVIVFFIGYQQVENYVFSPRITKRTMEIHPAISVAAIFIGGTLMGGIGVILALPVAGIIQAIIAESRKSYDVILDAEGEISTVET